MRLTYCLKNDSKLNSESIELMEDVNMSNINLDRIFFAVTLKTGIKKDVMLKKTRKREIVQARQLVQHFAKLKLDKSLSQIGVLTGLKDHATVLHSYKTVNNLKEFNKEFRKLYNEISELL